MATKLQYITKLSNDCTIELASVENWTAFLRLAAWQYKYSFEDQVLIFAQRPDATACADFVTWNEKLHRRIKRGAKGIALLREKGSGFFLDYVFDISDTYAYENGMDIKLWKYDDKYYDAVRETIENRYGETEGNINSLIQSAVRAISLNNRDDYLAEFEGQIAENRMVLSEDINDVGQKFQKILENSVSAIVILRMGLDPKDIFKESDFEDITAFDSVETITVLGDAVSSFAEDILREIGSTITAEVRAEQNKSKFFAENKNSVYNDGAETSTTSITERTDEDDRDNLQKRDGDNDTQLRGTEKREADREVRTDAEEIPEGTQTEHVFSNDDKRDIDGSPLRSEHDSEVTGGGNGQENGTGGGSDREIESGESAEMDRFDEQPQTFRRRGSNETVNSQLSLYDIIDTSNVKLDMQKEAERLINTRPAFSVPQEIIDIVLSDGANRTGSKLRICTQFSKQKTLEENAEFLKSEYRKGGKGFVINNQNVSLWFDDGGLKIQFGKENNRKEYDIYWEDAAKRIGELLDMGRYMPQSEIDAVFENERKELAETLIFLHRDSNIAYELGVEDRGTFPDVKEKLTKALESVEIQDNILNGLYELSDEFEKDASIIRFAKLHNLPEIIKAVEELNIPRKAYKAVEYSSFDGKRFITQNEVDSVILRGSDVSEGKMSIASFFLMENDSKKRENYLKQHYGIGGSTHAINGTGYEEHDGKGLVLKRDSIGMPYDTVTLSWTQVAKRIDFFIKRNMYLNEDEIKHIPTYEKNILVGNIYNAFINVSEFERYTPYPKGFNYHDATPIILSKLDDMAQRAEMFEELTILVAETPKDDRYYEHRKFTKDRLEKYINGQFDLFPGIKRIENVETEDLNRAKEAINKYIYAEFGNESADYSDLRKINLAFTETEDGEHTIEVEIDLVEFALNKYVDKVLVEAIQYDSLNDLIESEIEDATFDEFVYLTDEQLAPFYQKSEETLIDFVNRLHKDDDGETVVLIPNGDFYEIYGVDAEKVSAVFGYELTTKAIGDYGYAMCGFPKLNFENNLDVLNRRGFDVIITDEDKKSYKVLSAKKALGGVTEEIDVKDDESAEEHLAEMFGVSEENEIVVKEASEEFDFVGKELEIDDRRFVIDSVDEKSGSVSLKDITFQNNVGFPIFRKESIQFIKALSEQQKDGTVIPQFEKIKPSKVANAVIYPHIPMEERRNFVIDNDELGFGGPKEKFRKNMEAIRVLKECESEHRLATEDEQKTLSEYVGWGSLADAFDETKVSWTDEFKELYTALTPEEYEQARKSTLNAHYTSPVIIKAMYKALSNMGFSEGNILEPSCGIGNFMGIVPESMRDSKIYGIEIDSITGRIAQQLYQKNSVAIQGYEDTTLPDSFFDVAIGNVPFGDYKLSDRKYNKHNFLIHDYFFAKTLDKVRPGGIVAFITSSGTMDKRNSKVRQYIAQRADLVGAIRLPNNAFLKNAGTEVTADILFLQRRDRMTDIMPDWVNLSTLENGVTINQYFADNPDMILGDMKMVSGPFGPMQTCVPFEGAELSGQLDDAIKNIHATITEYELEDISNEENVYIPADPETKNFSFTVVDGDVYFRENSLMRKIDVNKAALNRIKGMINIRDCVRELIEYQIEGYSDFEIKEKQTELNALYDDFTKKYGLINSRGNAMAFSDDSSYFLLCSLEVMNENGELERKADMFTKRTIGAKTEVTKVDTASEALAVSLGEKARIDMEFMTSLTGKSEEELYNDLKGVIFMNPHYEPGNIYEPAYLTADEYLSGNVREKLSVVKSIAVNDSDYQINVDALEKVQPKDLSASEITLRLGSTWIPPEYIERFVFELLSPGWYARDKIKVKYSNITGEWNISNKTYDKGIKAVNTYGTHRINAYKIIEETLNLKDVRIFDYVDNGNGGKTPVLNKKETAIAQQKQELIKAAFDEWIWKDPSRREILTGLYNERFNSTRPREYDGSHITFSGMNPEIVLRKHQVDAVARIMYGGNSLLGHVVGAGKTWTMVAAAMESKRLGLCNKSLFVVPNHLTEQWASEFLQLYPAANILVATKKDFETKNRKKFCGRIATGDYDAVIIGHSQFEKIPMSVERQKEILTRQRDEIMYGIMEAKADKAERYTVKQLEKSRRSIESKLEKLNDQTRKDDVVTFEELGVDRIFVDEAHYYKNLYLYTKMRNVGGIAQTEAQKSSDLFMKTQYLDEITGGKGVIFATGTPVSNSMVELYTMQRYLQYGALKEKNLQHFDAWASTFGETITAIELAPEGTGYRAKTRFAKFFNLPELMSMFKDVADIQTADMLNLPTPAPHYKTIAIEPTETQKDMVSDLAERAEKVRNRMVDPSVDNMLKITNDGRKLALDQRLINPLLPDEDKSKVASCVEEVFNIWEQTKDIKGTQLVFCDLSTPKNDGSFNVYTDIKDKLTARGVPEDEVEFIHNADTEVKKKELFSRVRKGDVRILLGSTPKMGAGTNVQRLLYASHDLDCPWRPADLEQRSGRIIRQGNTNTDVHIFRYVTKDTFDSYMWQLVENKQKFISQIMTSKSPVRSAEDIDETALSYAEIKALATGNPHIKEKMDLDTQVAKLKLLKSSFLSQKYELEDKVIKEYPKEIANLTERIKGFETDIETASKYPKQEGKFYPMTIDGVCHTDKEKAGKALVERCQKLKTPEGVCIGEYRGFSMDLSFDVYSKVFYIALKGSLSHKVELSGDIYGNIQRLDNALESLGKRLDVTRDNLEETKKQFELAKVESKKDFPQESELQEKIKRLAEVDALLNMDKKDHDGAELGEPDEDEVPIKKSVERER